MNTTGGGGGMEESHMLFYLVNWILTRIQCDAPQTACVWMNELRKFSRDIITLMHNSFVCGVGSVEYTK